MNIDDLDPQYSSCATFKFGDNEDLSRRLIALVRSGEKTATCGGLRDYEAENEALGVTGQREIILNWDDTPAVAIEVVSVSVMRYCDIGETFALAEGENDSLEGWRADHKAYFERNGGFDPAMQLVCVSFELVEDFSTAD